MRLARLGATIAFGTGVLTLLTIGVSVLTPPLSGPFCAADCFTYPYSDIAGRFPRDYLWMYAAMALSLAHVALIVCVYEAAARDRRVFGLLGLSAAVMSATLLVGDYFVQLAVVQPSLLAGEADGIALLTQYNPHGVFIALEEAGYLLMALSLTCIAPVFEGAHRLDRSLRAASSSTFPIALGALVLVGLIYGVEREYRFEVAAIVIDWVALAIVSFLLAARFRRGSEVRR